jgi:molecular chaperone GrpE (heat shock protein)
VSIDHASDLPGDIDAATSRPGIDAADQAPQLADMAPNDATPGVDTAQDGDPGPADEGAQTSAGSADASSENREQLLAVLETRITATDARLAALATRLDTADGLAQDARATADSAVVDVAAARAEVDLANRAVTAGTAAAAATTAKVDALAKRLTAADTRLAELGGLVDGLDGSVSRFDGLVRGLDERLAENDGALADVHRAIAARVEQYTSDALVQSQQSLQLAVNSIAQLALAMAESSRDLVEDVSAESATVLLDSFRVDLDAILAQLGFEPLQTAVGEMFDPHRHRALKRIATADPLQDKTVTRVIRDGYRNVATGRILLFADVEVSRHRA